MADQQNSWLLTETYKSLITISVESLKLIALVNGGAAVGVLTYVGNFAARSSPGGSTRYIKWALLCYCGGLLMTMFAFIISYWTQNRLYREERNIVAGGINLKQTHQIGVRLGVAFASLGAFLFGAGCWLAADAITTVR
jgi:hypothetical protein